MFESQIRMTKEEITRAQKTIQEETLKLEDLVHKFENDKKQMYEQHEALKEELTMKLRQKTESLDIITKFKAQKEELIAYNKNLEIELKTLQSEKADKIANKKADKVKATDKLKKEMLEKIQVTKTELFALKKEQLEPKTRLTVLQNYQLTTELEYQSKQTEKLFFKNQKLLEQVKALRRDVEIHKQVETELAKRSHFCEKLIGKLKKRLSEIEEESHELKAEIENNHNNAAAMHDRNEIKQRRLEMMAKDKETFERKLALSQNVGCVSDTGSRTSGDRTRQTRAEVRSGPEKRAHLQVLVGPHAAGRAADRRPHGRRTRRVALRERRC